MSEYKGIRGWKVQTVSTDPAASLIATGSWASGGSLNTARAGLGGAGTQSTALVFFGSNNPAPSYVGNTELYNGTSWTELADGNSIRGYLAGFGTSTAAIGTGGYSPGGDSALTESWNGSAWTEVGDLNTGRPNIQNANAGVSTAGLVWGGYNPPGTPTNSRTITESWNGTSWTEVNDLNTNRYDTGGNGTQTDAITVFGTTGAGFVPSGETWNGTSWTTVASGNTVRTGNALTGNSTSALTFSGAAPSYVGLTEYYNGSSWTELADLTTGRNLGTSSQAGTTSETLLAGGRDSPTRISVTEEWTLAPTFQQINLGQVYYNSTSNSFKVTQQSIPVGTWGSGGNLPAPMYIGTSCGTSNTSGMAMTGFSDPGITYSSAAYQYDGASWTTVASLNTGKNNASSAKNSPITTTLNYAGDGPGTYSATNESWNNTSWTEEADLNVSGNAATGFGVSSTSAGRAGGQSSVTPPAGPHFTGTEIWNGTSWTEVSDLAASRRYAGGVGTVTAALFIGGDTDNPAFPGGRYTARVESWNGTSWTEIADLNTGRYSLGTSGTQTSALAFGGGTPANTTATEFWNGTSWTELNDMATARRGGTGNGSSTSALSVAGESPASPPFIATTEEWNAGTANFTITVS